jgi:hypothetical protein
MSILNELRILSECISSMVQVRNSLVDKAVSMGVCWEEIAFIDKFSAIKVCQRQGHTLREAYQIVFNYIEQYK